MIEQKKQSSDANRKLHYAWIIALTGTAVLFSCLGLGRFSLGMLLPSMGKSLGLSYSQMGLIGTGNFVGYMISVVWASIIARFIGSRWTVSLGLILVGCSMIFISKATGFIGIMALYITTGIRIRPCQCPYDGACFPLVSEKQQGAGSRDHVVGKRNCNCFYRDVHPVG